MWTVRRCGFWTPTTTACSKSCLDPPLHIYVRPTLSLFIAGRLQDEVMRRVLEERPLHFLSTGYTDWDALLSDVLLRSLQDSDASDDAPSWGVVNRLNVSHPLAGVPGLGALLGWPTPELPGNTFTLRVAQPIFGAVIRMNVRPAAPENGILQFAGGQSGHFLSPNYSDQLAAWADGTPTPFLAGPTAHSYTLRPAP